MCGRFREQKYRQNDQSVPQHFPYKVTYHRRPKILNESDEMILLFSKYVYVYVFRAQGCQLLEMLFMCCRCKYHRQMFSQCGYC